MKAENSGCTKETVFSVGNETIVIERFGKNDYSVYLTNGDYSVRGTLLDVITEIQKGGFDLSEAVSLPEEEEKTYLLTYEERGFRGPQNSVVRGKDLEDALYQFAENCMEEDHTGIFFPLEDADVEALEKEAGFHNVNVDGIQLGIILIGCKTVETYNAASS